MASVYTNPIIDRGLPDPNILVVNGTYYLFATGKGDDQRQIPIYRSRNLRDWEFVRGAVARGDEGAWNRRNFWAPEAIEIDGVYHLYYTASVDGTPKNTGNRVGLAVSSKPEGPYEDRGVVIPHASLDGHPFRDRDGTLYMYYTIEHGNSDGLVAGRIYVDTMPTPDRVSGKPVLLVAQHHWQEGPHMLLREGRYYLTYSTGAWTDDTYRVRWAIGSSAVGPFVEQSTFILESTDLVKGPGHHSFFVAPDGTDWIVYHGWDPKRTARFPRIDPLVRNDQGLSCPGPSMTPQPLPRDSTAVALANKPTDKSTAPAKNVPAFVEPQQKGTAPPMVAQSGADFSTTAAGRSVMTFMNERSEPALAKQCAVNFARRTGFDAEILQGAAAVSVEFRDGTAEITEIAHWAGDGDAEMIDCIARDSWAWVGQPIELPEGVTGQSTTFTWDYIYRVHHHIRPK